MMGDVLAIGDEVRVLASNVIAKVVAVYPAFIVLRDENMPRDVYRRHEVTPLKWEAAKVGRTGLGVCAQGANGQ